MTALILHWSTDCHGGGWLTQGGFPVAEEGALWGWHHISAVPCATSVPPSAHCCGLASPTRSHLCRELAARKLFWAFWLTFVCYPPQHWIGWFATRKPPCLPAPRWGVSLSMYPSTSEGLLKELYVWEKKGNRKKDGVAGRDHCWLLQKKDFTFLKALRIL